MKRLFILFTFLLPCAAIAQNTDYTKIILPENVKQVSFEEKLVQLAWKNNPENKIVTQNVRMLDRQKNLAKFTWLNNFTGTVNLNEFTLDPSSDVLNRQYYYPKYNIGLQVSLGTFFLTPIQTKIANDRVLMGEQEVNQQKLLIRNDVLTGIEKLKESYKVLRLRTRLKEDFLLLYREAEKKFSLGEIKIDEYRLASQAYYSRMEAEINAQSEFNQSKIAMEAIIGLALEDIEGYNTFLSKLNEEIKGN